MESNNSPLSDLAEKARLAHYGTSFSPEKRGEQMIKEYESLLTADLELIKEAPGEIKKQYTERFKNHLLHYLTAKGRIISPMIAGPSNFPVRRMEKYHRWEDSAYKKFKDFRTKALNGIQKQIQADKPKAQVIDEAWEKIKSNILGSASTIIAIDTGQNTYSARPLFVSSITGLIKRMAANGQAEHVKRAIELIRELNSKAKKPLITERNEIFKLVDLAEKVEQVREEKANREPAVFPFEDGQVIINYPEQRIQLKYDIERVPTDLYRQLTRELHFRYSPTNKAFQLYINNQSIQKVNKVTGLNIPYL